MAKYEAEFKCGHSEIIQLYGKTSMREWILEQKKSELCSECQQVEYRKQAEMAKNEALQIGLPELEGSEKQIQWAEQIRKEILSKFDNAEKEHKGYGDNLIATAKVYEFLSGQTKSSFWIDNRDSQTSNISRIIRVFGSEIIDNSEKELQKKLEQEKQQKEALLKKEADIEATIYPEGFKTNLITEIKIDNEEIKICYPEYNPGFVDIMRSLRLSWDKNKYWTRKIPENSIRGKIEDRIAEIAYKLLSKKFPVRIYDEELRNRAISGDFKPEHARWILKRTEGKYINHFVIHYLEGDYYGKARKISGSKYADKTVFIPLDSIDELIDFANMYDFKFSSGAKQLIEEAEKLKEKKIFVNIKSKPEEEKPAISNVPIKLEIPENIEIDDEFKD